MAADERMSIAKGAAIALLRTAYLRRDRVAVVVFEQETARVLLEPTRSVDRARERLRALPASGATPLPAGLWTAHQLIAAERLRDPKLVPTLVLLSDGQSNVPMDPMAYAPREALAVADRIRAESVSALVVDVVCGPASPPALVDPSEPGAASGVPGAASARAASGAPGAASGAPGADDLHAASATTNERTIRCFMRR
jgi:Mg-chelatase subunit ChlD